MNLYQINNEINELILNCDESGEIDATKFDQLTIEKEKKQENIIFVLLNQDAELDAYYSEIKRLKTQKERLEKKNEWLKEANSQSQQSICIMGCMYYDWEGRPFGMLIPVLDPQGNPIPCTQDSEE
jgi:hypothetical protein